MSRVEAIRFGAWLLLTASIWQIGCAQLSPTAAQEANARTTDRREGLIDAVKAHRIDAQYRAALTNWRQGEITECRQTLDDLLNRAPDHRDALMLWAEWHLAHGDALAALPRLQRAVARSPQDLQLGQLLAQLTGAAAKKKPESVREAGLANRQAPPRLAAQGSADELAEAVAPRSSLDAWRNAPGHDPLKTPTSRTPDTSVATAAYAADAGEDDDAVQRVVALSAVDGQQGDKTQQAVERAAAELHGGNPVAAMQIATTALERTPNASRLWQIVGLCHYRLGAYGAAQVALAQALSLDNTSPASYFLMGSVLTKLGRHEEARWHSERATALRSR